MADDPLQSNLTDRELFSVAADHFSGDDYQPETLDTLWALLGKQALSTNELADRIDADVSELDLFLDWAADQGIIQRRDKVWGTFYSRFDSEMDDLSKDSGRKGGWLGQIIFESPMNPALVGGAVFGVLGFGVSLYSQLSELPHKRGGIIEPIFVSTLGMAALGVVATMALHFLAPKLLDRVSDRLSDASSNDPDDESDAGR